MAKAKSLAEARSHNVGPDVFRRHYQEIRQAVLAQKDAAAAVTRTRKAAKADGIDLDALRLLQRFATIELEDAEVELRHLFTYAGWINLPIGTQTDLFGEPRPANGAGTPRNRNQPAQVEAAPS